MGLHLIELQSHFEKRYAYDELGVGWGIIIAILADYTRTGIIQGQESKYPSVVIRQVSNFPDIVCRKWVNHKL